MHNATFLATIEKPVRDHLWKKKNHANKSEGGVIVCSFF